MMAHDVFISYSNKDKTIADAVCAKLEDEKIRCWMAPRDVPPGANFASTIVDAIESCKVFVLIWSANTNTSEHILNELNQAFDSGITVIPFRVENVEPSKSLKYYIGRTHWLDAMTPPLEKHIQTLADTIFNLLGIKRKGRVAIKAEPLRQVAKSENVLEVQAKVATPRKGMNIFPVAAGAIVVVMIIVLLLSGLFKGPEPIATTKSTITSLPSTQQAAIDTPVPAWVEEIGKPILAAIMDHSPVFQDDFSYDNENWQFNTSGSRCTDASMSIMGGVMQINTSHNCIATANLSTLHFDHFVLQVDVNDQQVSMDGDSGVLINRKDKEGNDIGSDSFALFGQGYWELNLNDTNSTSSYLHTDGQIPFENTKPITITLMSKGSEIVVYLNDIPITHLSDPLRPSTDNYFSLRAWSQSDSSIVLFKNLKIWNLNNLNQSFATP